MEVAAAMVLLVTVARLALVRVEARAWAQQEGPLREACRASAMAAAAVAAPSDEHALVPTAAGAVVGAAAAVHELLLETTCRRRLGGWRAHGKICLDETCRACQRPPTPRPAGSACIPLDRDVRWLQWRSMPKALRRTSRRVSALPSHSHARHPLPHCSSERLSCGRAVPTRRRAPGCCCLAVALAGSAGDTSAPAHAASAPTVEC